MKNYFQKLLLVTFTFASLLACSVDSGSILTNDTTDSTNIERRIEIGKDITPIQVTYVEGLSLHEIDKIKDSFKRDPFINLQFYSDCPENESSSTIEIWYVAIDYKAGDRGPDTKDPKEHIESNSGVSRAYVGLASCD